MVQPSLTGLDYQKLLSWYGFHEEHGLRKKFFHFFKTVIKLFKTFKVFVPCLKNEAIDQLKANFIYWKATPVSLDYTHRLAVCAHFGLWYYKLKSVSKVLSPKL